MLAGALRQFVTEVATQLDSIGQGPVLDGAGESEPLRQVFGIARISVDRVAIGDCGGPERTPVGDGDDVAGHEVVHAGLEDPAARAAAFIHPAAAGAPALAPKNRRVTVLPPMPNSISVRRSAAAPPAWAGSVNSPPKVTPRATMTWTSRAMLAPA